MWIYSVVQLAFEVMLLCCDSSIVLQKYGLYEKMALLLRSLAHRPRIDLVRFYNKIVITDDGTTIVALHQDREEFPYEFSKPLPEEAKEDNSVLKMSDIKEVKRVFKDMSPEMARQQLCSLTLTTKHRWFPRARDKKAKKGEMNRPYL